MKHRQTDRCKQAGWKTAALGFVNACCCMQPLHFMDGLDVVLGRRRRQQGSQQAVSRSSKYLKVQSQRCEQITTKKTFRNFTSLHVQVSSPAGNTFILILDFVQRVILKWGWVEYSLVVSVLNVGPALTNGQSEQARFQSRLLKQVQ